MKRCLKFSVSWNTSFNSSFYFRSLVYANYGHSSPSVKTASVVDRWPVLVPETWGGVCLRLGNSWRRGQFFSSSRMMFCPGAAWKHDPHLAASLRTKPAWRVAGSRWTEVKSSVTLLSHGAMQPWSPSHPCLRWDDGYSCCVIQLQPKSFDLQQKPHPCTSVWCCDSGT